MDLKATPIGRALTARLGREGLGSYRNPNGQEALAMLEELYSVLKRVRDAASNTDNPFVAAWCKDTDAALTLVTGEQGSEGDA